MLVKSRYGIGQHSMISVIVYMIDVLIVTEICKVNTKIIWNGVVI